MQTILRITIISLALLISHALSALAGPYEDGIEATKRGDYEAALNIFRTLADDGDPQGQTGLGRMYQEGRGVPQDFAEALKWYRMAADQGYAGAQNNLGVMYGKGQGVGQDIVKAAEWYRKAAEQGYAIAQKNLGDRYRLGDSVPQDYTEAAKWYRKAAQQGNSQAQYNLAVMYRRGQGVPKNFAEAAKWYEKAAEQGHAAAVNWLSFSISEEYLAKFNTFDCNQIKAEIASLAERYEYEATPRMIDGTMFFGGNIGYIIAIKELVSVANRKSCEDRSFDCSDHPQTCDALIRDGFDAFQSGDFAMALREIRPLAEHGIGPAQFAFGIMYEFGDGVEVDLIVAVEWYRRAAEQGHPTAQRNLGNMYFNGRGVPQDMDKAIDWYRKAADRGNISAQFNIGYVYASVKEDYVAALEWWLKSAHAGYPPAMSNLGILYRDGLGTAQNKIQAYMWFYLAAELADQQAKHWRDELANSMSEDQIAEAEKLAREWKEKN